MINTTDGLHILKNKLSELHSNCGKFSESENKDVQYFNTSYDFITILEELNRKEFQHFIKQQSDRFPREEKEYINNNYKDISDFLEVITDPEVVSLIAKKLSEKYSEKVS